MFRTSVQPWRDVWVVVRGVGDRFKCSVLVECVSGTNVYLNLPPQFERRNAVEEIQHVLWIFNIPPLAGGGRARRGPGDPDPGQPEPGRLVPPGLLAAARIAAPERHHRQPGPRRRDPVQPGPAGYQVRVLALLLQLDGARLAHVDGVHHHGARPAHQPVGERAQRQGGPGVVVPAGGRPLHQLQDQGGEPVRVAPEPEAGAALRGRRQPVRAQGPDARRLVPAAGVHRVRGQGERGLHVEELHHEAEHPREVHRVVSERDDPAGAVAAAVPAGGLPALQGVHRPPGRRREHPVRGEGGRAPGPGSGGLQGPRSWTRLQHLRADRERGRGVGADDRTVPHRPPAADERDV